MVRLIANAPRTVGPLKRLPMLISGRGSEVLEHGYTKHFLLCSATEGTAMPTQVSHFPMRRAWHFIAQWASVHRHLPSGGVEVRPVARRSVVLQMPSRPAVRRGGEG